MILSPTRTSFIQSISTYMCRNKYLIIFRIVVQFRVVNSAFSIVQWVREIFPLFLLVLGTFFRQKSPPELRELQRGINKGTSYLSYLILMGRLGPTKCGNTNKEGSSHGGSCDSLSHRLIGAMAVWQLLETLNPNPKSNSPKKGLACHHPECQTEQAKQLAAASQQQIMDGTIYKHRLKENPGFEIMYFKWTHNILFH